jgi:molybdenum-dependent DNA-binding transcriptional regulator ModE
VELLKRYSKPDYQGPRLRRMVDRAECWRQAATGASINAAAKASEINYRTAQRIVEAAAERRQRQLVAAS